jgi:hypothetical protein
MNKKNIVSATYNKALIGRSAELALLTESLNHKRPEFIAVYGRRRIGKTFLIRQAFQGQKNYIEVTGVRKAKAEVQIRNFLTAFDKCVKLPYGFTSKKSWSDVLELFTEWLEKQKSQVVLFLDELPWLVGKKNTLLSLIDFYWNTRWSKLNNFILVICGSASSWIIEKILHDTGGLYNRVTKRVHLHPFTLKETDAYLKSNNRKFSAAQVIELYLVFGGVPYYLDLLPKTISPAQAINQIIYEKLGQLHEEYDLLTQALFREPELHNQILSLLCKHRYGLSRTEIAKSLKISDGGGLTRSLLELENCDFIKGYLPFRKKAHWQYYRVIDEFTLFYNRWLRALKQKSLRLSKDFWLKQQGSSSFNAFCGYNFETICQKHVDEIISALGISGVSVETSTWKQQGSRDVGGTQIDLVLDRADKIINICEIKYNQIPVTITKKEAEHYLRRAEIFKAATRTRKTVNSVLISFTGARETEYFHRAFIRCLEADVFFR